MVQPCEQGATASPGFRYGTSAARLSTQHDATTSKTTQIEGLVPRRGGTSNRQQFRRGRPPFRETMPARAIGTKMVLSGPEGASIPRLPHSPIRPPVRHSGAGRNPEGWWGTARMVPRWSQQDASFSYFGVPAPTGMSDWYENRFPREFTLREKQSPAWPLRPPNRHSGESRSPEGWLGTARMAPRWFPRCASFSYFGVPAPAGMSDWYENSITRGASSTTSSCHTRHSREGMSRIRLWRAGIQRGVERVEVYRADSSSYEGQTQLNPDHLSCLRGAHAWFLPHVWLQMPAPIN